MSSKNKTTATKEEAMPDSVPKLRFPAFREEKGWENRLIGPYLEDCSGRVPPDTELPVYSSTREGLKRQDAYFDGRVLQNNNEYGMVPPGCFVYRHMSDDGLFKFNVNETGSEIAVSKEYPVFSTRGLNPVFLLAQLNGSLDFKNFALSQKAGGTRTRLYFSRLCEWRTLLPSITEQQKIAECLSSVDELLTAQARKVDALKTHKKGLMQQLFPREGETKPRLRFPEFQDAGEWELTTVGELVETGRLFLPKDGNHGNIHPKSSDYVANGVPFIMASDLNGGLIDIVNCHFISKEQADTLQKGFANEGDVLLSHKGTVGEVAVVREICTPYLMLTPQVTYYRVKDRKKLSNEFLAQLFLSDAFQSNLLEVSGGGTRAYIGITAQAKLRLQLPKDVEEQQRIASCLSSLDTLITLETQKLEALKTHKKGLMQQLFPSPEELEA
jgi:type I restriction enzyme S subunit